jgi:hypothetical protein
MRILGTIILTSSILFASNLVVKKADVVVLLNNVEKSLSKGNELALDYGTSICFKNGNGRVVINNRIQLKKPGKCYLIPVPKGFDIKDYMAKAKEMVSVAMIDSSESVRHGVSTKGTNDLDDGKDIILKKGDKELVIYSEEFGPHPVIVNLKDENGNILISLENEENDITFFKVASSSIETGYRVEILNGFDENLIDKKIVKE